MAHRSGKILIQTVIVLGLFLFSCQKQNRVTEDKNITPKQKRISKIEQIKKEIASDTSLKKDSLALEVFNNYNENRSTEEGVEFLEQFYDKSSNSDSILYLLSIENYKLKKLEEALTYLKKLQHSSRFRSTADNLIFSIITKKEKADSYYSSGMEKYNQGELDAAVNLFQSALRVQIDHTLCLYYKNLAQGRSYLDRGDQVSLKLACSLLEAAVKCQPENGITYYYLALAHKNKAKSNSQKVIECYQTALKKQLSHEQRVKISEEYEAYQSENHSK